MLLTTAVSALSLLPPLEEAAPAGPGSATTHVLAEHAAKTPRPPSTSRVRGSRAAGSRCVDHGPGWTQRRGRLALARMRFDWHALGYQVRFRPAERGLLGITYAATRRIDIYVRSCSAQSDDLLAVTLAHELGHAFDIRYGTRARHAAWLRLRGIDPRTPWYPGPRASQDFTYGCGDFAEVFALWQVNGRYFASELAPRPSAASLARLIQLMRP